MAQEIGLELDTRAFLASLRLTGKQVEKAMAKAMNRTIFEIRDAEAEHVGSIFEFAGSGTRSFLTRASGAGQAFRFRLATPDRLEAELFPAPKTGRILEEHQRGATIEATTSAGQGKVAKHTTRLAIEGKLAVPVEAKRGASGRVGRKRARTFVAGKAVLQRVGKGAGSKVRVLFALVEKAKLKPRFDFYRVARDTAQRTFGAKAREEFGKVRAR